ncbi:MAG TPA: hypothetical protein VGB75_17740 [Jatrophihabitans sp.]|jgi:hypothetical protein|uniref:hypothetical protein n=1 Tax=Jatrophihabitans sp. TaxID=1932789 RepID=UPI002EEE9F85
MRHKTTLRASLAAGALALGLAVAGATPANAATPLDDDFSSYTVGQKAEGTTFGNWTNVFDGARWNPDNTYTRGVTSIIQPGGVGTTKYLQQSPPPALAPGQTFSSLTTSNASFSGAYTLLAEYGNEVQLRQGSTPNPWERGWLLFNYTNNNSFVAVVLKTNGWQLSKEYTDPVDGSQRECFLATGTSPTYSLSSWKRVTVTQTVNASGQPTWVVQARTGSNALTTLTTYTDTGACGVTPYTSGKIGFYTEDAKLRWGWARVTTP